MPRVIFIAAAAATARRPPFTAERCFRTELISSIDAPQVTRQRFSLNIGERNVGIERLLDQRRASAGQEEKDQGPIIGGGEQFQNRAARYKTVFIGNWVAGDD